MSNLTSANNLTIANNLTVGGNALFNGIMEAENVTCTNLEVNTLNNLTIQNLTSLDTTSSLTYQLQNLSSSLKAYIDNKINLLFNNPDLSLNSIMEISNALQGNPNIVNQIIASLSDKVSLTTNNQEISGNYVKFSGLNNSFTNPFTTPDILLPVSADVTKSVNGSILALESRATNNESNIGNLLYRCSDVSGNTVIRSNGGLNGEVLKVNEIGSGNTISMIPNASNTAFNNMTRAGALITTNNTNGITMTMNGIGATGINIKNNNMILGSGDSNGTMMPKNYMYIDSTGIGVNKAASSTFDISGTLAVSSNINCNDVMIGSVDPLLGTTATLTQRFEEYYQNIHDNTVAVHYLQSQINGLDILKLKAYGMVSYTGPQNVKTNEGVVINQKYYTLNTSYNVNTTASYYGVTGTNPITYDRRVGYAYIRLSTTDALGFAFVQSEAYTSSVKRLDNMTFEIFLSGGGELSLPQDWSFYFIVF